MFTRTPRDCCCLLLLRPFSPITSEKLVPGTTSKREKVSIVPAALLVCFSRLKLLCNSTDGMDPATPREMRIEHDELRDVHQVPSSTGFFEISMMLLALEYT